MFFIFLSSIFICRYFLTSLTGMDVPMLYSPLPFENAALSAPEVGLYIMPIS